MRPADRCMRNVTIGLITVPSIYTLVAMVILKAEYTTLAKAIVGGVYFMQLFLCLRALIKTSLTDPGILPSVNQISLIPELSKRYPDPEREYIIEY